MGGGDVELDEVGSMHEDGKNVWVTGQTGSSNFPTLNPGAGTYFQVIAPGSAVLFMLQFNTAGVLKWATYYGGTGGDDAISICSDKRNVWITGVTESNDFPLLNPGGGTYFQATKGGNLTAFILQFDITGVRKWATYYGGNAEEYGNSIQSDGTHVWLTGETYSRIFPTLNPGGGAFFQAAIGGGANAFIAKFDTTRWPNTCTQNGGEGSGDGEGNGDHKAQKRSAQIQDTLNNIIAKVYPNPANTLLNVEVNVQNGQTAYFVMYNAIGEKIESMQLTNEMTSLSINNLPSGMYYYRITNKDGNVIKADKQMILH